MPVPVPVPVPEPASVSVSDPIVESISANLAAVRARIDRAAARARRDPAGVRLVGVTKTQPPGVAVAAVRAGVEDLGENYAVELAAKAAAVEAAGLSPRWHFIGHLQSNKVRQVLPVVAAIHSVDRPSVVQEIGRRAVGPLDVFIEVSIAGEAQKSGADPGVVADLCRMLLEVPSVRLAGLMCVPPWSDDPEASRPHFRALREMRDRLAADLRAPDGALAGLSMGMSHDLEVAIEEGATVVRVGTALFGERHYPAGPPQ